MSQAELTTALARLVELAEFELLSPACPDPPPGWQQGLKEATVTTRKFLAEIREPAGRFFTSADEKRHKLNSVSAKENEMSSKTNFSLEIVALVEKALRGQVEPDRSSLIVKEVKRLWDEKFDDPAKTKDTKPAQPSPLFQTGYLGGPPPIAGGSDGSKSKEQRQGIGLLDGLFAANQRQNGANKR